MSARCIVASETLDPQATTWAEFVRLSADDCAAMEGILTPRAFRVLLGSERTFERLSDVFGQIFSFTPVFALGPEGFRQLLGVADRARYSAWFLQIQYLVVHNTQARVDNASSGVCDQSRFQNMSFIFVAGEGGVRAAGFSPYFRFFWPEVHGEERIFAFHHKPMRKVVLAAIPGLQHMPAFLQFVCESGTVVAFDKTCGWCGKTSEDLLKCPCKGVRYCGADCQRRHWALHRVACCKRPPI